MIRLPRLAAVPESMLTTFYLRHNETVTIEALPMSSYLIQETPDPRLLLLVLLAKVVMLLYPVPAKPGVFLFSQTPLLPISTL